MKKIFLVSLVIVLVSGLIFGGSAIAAPKKPIELRFAHHSSPASWLSHNAIEPWARKVEKATNGRVKITIYPAQTLCKGREVINATKAGVTDIGLVLLGMFPGRFPLTSVTALPFMNLPSGTVGGRALGPDGVNSHILQELYETFPEIQAEWAEVKVLFLHVKGPFFLMTTNKPVRNQADLKGLKVRALGGPPTEMWKLLGAAPINLPMPAIYEAAEKGVIAGACADWGGIIGYRFYEIFRYKHDVAPTVAQFGVIMNKEKWNGLPPDIQEAITSLSGVRGAVFFGDTDLGPKRGDIARAQVEKKGYYLKEVSLDPGELEKWKDIVCKPLWNKWVADTEAKGLPGQKVLDQALRLIEKYK